MPVFLNPTWSTPQHETARYWYYGSGWWNLVAFPHVLVGVEVGGVTDVVESYGYLGTTRCGGSQVATNDTETTIGPWLVQYIRRLR